MRPLSEERTSAMVELARSRKTLAGTVEPVQTTGQKFICSFPFPFCPLHFHPKVTISCPPRLLVPRQFCVFSKKGMGHRMSQNNRTKKKGALEAMSSNPLGAAAMPEGHSGLPHIWSAVPEPRTSHSASHKKELWGVRRC